MTIDLAVVVEIARERWATVRNAVAVVVWGSKDHDLNDIRRAIVVAIGCISRKFEDVAHDFGASIWISKDVGPSFGHAVWSAEGGGPVEHVG